MVADVCCMQDPTHKKKGQGSTISGHSLAVDEWRASVAFSISPLLSYSSDVVPGGATATATAPAAATAAAADTKPPALGTRPRQASQVGMKGKDDIITANLNNPSTPPVATVTTATEPTSKEKEDEKKKEKEKEKEEKKEKRASTKSKRSSATFSAASIITSKDKQEKEKEKAAAAAAASAAAAAQPAVSAPVPAAAAVAAATDMSGAGGLPATTTLINFEKYSLVAAKVTELLACQSSSYCFEEVEFIQRWLGKVLGECLDEETISATAKTLNDKVIPPTSFPTTHLQPHTTFSRVVVCVVWWCSRRRIHRRTRGHRPSSEASPRRSPR
jgi:hypothetical protein